MKQMVNWANKLIERLEVSAFNIHRKELFSEEELVMDFQEAIGVLVLGVLEKNKEIEETRTNIWSEHGSDEADKWKEEAEALAFRVLVARCQKEVKEK